MQSVDTNSNTQQLSGKILKNKMLNFCLMKMKVRFLRL